MADERENLSPIHVGLNVATGAAPSHTDSVIDERSHEWSVERCGVSLVAPAVITNDMHDSPHRSAEMLGDGSWEWASVWPDRIGDYRNNPQSRPNIDGCQISIGRLAVAPDGYWGVVFCAQPHALAVPPHGRVAALFAPDDRFARDADVQDERLDDVSVGYVYGLVPHTLPDWTEVQLTSRKGAGELSCDGAAD